MSYSSTCISRINILASPTTAKGVWTFTISPFTLLRLYSFPINSLRAVKIIFWSSGNQKFFLRRCEFQLLFKVLDFQQRWMIWVFEFLNVSSRCSNSTRVPIFCCQSVCCRVYNKESFCIFSLARSEKARASINLLWLAGRSANLAASSAFSFVSRCMSFEMNKSGCPFFTVSPSFTKTCSIMPLACANTRYIGLCFLWCPMRR